MTYISAFFQLLPVITKLISLFISTPQEKQRQMIAGLHAAMASAKEGDTSKLEEIIRNGK